MTQLVKPSSVCHCIDSNVWEGIFNVSTEIIQCIPCEICLVPSWWFWGREWLNLSVHWFLAWLLDLFLFLTLDSFWFWLALNMKLLDYVLLSFNLCFKLYQIRIACSILILYYNLLCVTCAENKGGINNGPSFLANLELVIILLGKIHMVFF